MLWILIRGPRGEFQGARNKLGTRLIFPLFRNDVFLIGFIGLSLPFLWHTSAYQSFLASVSQGHSWKMFTEGQEMELWRGPSSASCCSPPKKSCFIHCRIFVVLAAEIVLLFIYYNISCHAIEIGKGIQSYASCSVCRENHGCCPQWLFSHVEIRAKELRPHVEWFQWFCLFQTKAASKKEAWTR